MTIGICGLRLEACDSVTYVRGVFQVFALVGLFKFQGSYRWSLGSRSPSQASS
jgi:hypothetical protein